MSRLGMFCFLGTGHLYPALALARRLKTRGHQVTVFHGATARAAICGAGLDFCSIDETNVASQPGGDGYWSSGVRSALVTAMAANTRRILSKAPKAVKEADIDGLIIDQADPAAGSVADFLGLPFVTLCTSPPADLCKDVPPPYFNWRNGTGPIARLRNRMGNALVSHTVAPILATVNDQRKAWGLKQFSHMNELFSTLGIITQLPESLDFTRVQRPARLFYAGPLLDREARSQISFPWHRLQEKPLIYASMGTILNDRPEVFRVIAEACNRFEAQLVISLGGGTLCPDEVGSLPGHPIVVHYAPQLDILRRAILTITHAGLNTTLESLYEGVPLVAIPVNNDQPGIAARIDWAGVGQVVPFRKLSLEALRRAIGKLLSDERYKRAADRIKMEMKRKDSLECACTFIEQALGIGGANRSFPDSTLPRHSHKDSNNAGNVRLRS